MRNEWGGTIYPCVPSHEIVGRVVKVGREVRKFKEGDLAAVGCLVDSDRVCENCHAGLGLPLVFSPAPRIMSILTDRYCWLAIEMTDSVMTMESPDGWPRRRRRARAQETLL